MPSYVGNTGFLWECSIVHEKNGTVGSWRIRRIKVPTIFRSGLNSHLNIWLSHENRRERKGAERSGVFRAKRGGHKQGTSSLNIRGQPMPIEAWAASDYGNPRDGSALLLAIARSDSLRSSFNSFYTRYLEKIEML